MSRTTAAYCQKNTSGVISLYNTGANYPRISRVKDTNGQYLIGAQYEVERTNYALYSNALESWATLTNLNAASAQSISNPFDTSPLPRNLSEDSTNGYHLADCAYNISLTSGTRYTLWIIAKASNRNWLRLALVKVGGGGDSVTQFINFTDGTAGTSTNSANVVYNKTTDFISKDLGNNWYLCGITFIMNATQTSYIQLGVADADNSLSFQGLNQLSLYLLHAQLEQGSYPSSPILTTTTAATRTADTGLVLVGEDNIGGKDTQKGSVLCDICIPSPPTSARTLWSLESDTTGDYIKLEVTTDGYLNLTSSYAAGSGDFDFTYETNVCDNQIYRIGVPYQNGLSKIFVKNLFSGLITSVSSSTSSAEVPVDLDRIYVGPTEYGVIGRLIVKNHAFKRQGLIFR